jgi:hypothetical protein
MRWHFQEKIFGGTSLLFSIAGLEGADAFSQSLKFFGLLDQSPG